MKLTPFSKNPLISAFIALFSLALPLAAQTVVSTIPTFIDPQDSLTIVVDLKEMDTTPVHVQNLLADAQAGLDLYIWTWNPREHIAGHPYVNGTGAQPWKNSNNALKMTSLGNLVYSYTFTPTLLSWYATDTATAYDNGLSFLVKPKDGGGYGAPDRKSDDLHLPIPRPGLTAEIISHNYNFSFALPSDLFNLVGATTINADLTLSLNGQILLSLNDTNQLSYALTGLDTGLNEIIFSATLGNQTDADTIYYLVRGATPVAFAPSGAQEGITYTANNKVSLQLRAPFKQFVYVVGDFNNWTPHPDYEMNKTPNGPFFWIELDNLAPGQKYRFQYHIDPEGMRVADPYSTLVLDEWNDPWIDAATYPGLMPYPSGKTTHPVGVLEPGKTPYAWDNTFTYTRPDRNDLIVYELHIRDFDARHTYQSVIDRLDYLEKLGINALQLMPVMEFEGNDSWGYNPMFMFASDKYYGTEEKLKELVEECHRRGMAVILDIVLNHQFGQSPMVRMYFDPSAGQYGQPTAQNPWFNEIPKHDFNVGYDMNHQSPATQYFSKKVMDYWLDEFKIDGFRFDLSKGFTQNNTLGNVGAWGQYDASRVALWQDYGNHVWQNHPGTFMILEHFADNSEEQALSQMGFMIWGNINHQSAEASMGYTSDLSWAYGPNRGWGEPHLISYMESHDEERVMYKNLQFGRVQGSYNIKSLPTALDRAALTAAVFQSIPGPKMIWQFGELGYDVSIDDPCRVCVKPIRWEYLNDPDRRDLYAVFQAVHWLKRNHPNVMRKAPSFMGLNGYTKYIKLEDNGDHVLVYGNFDAVSANVQPFFPTTGWWYDLLSGDSLLVNDPNVTLTYAPGEYHIYSNRRWYVAADVPLSTNEPVANHGSGVKAYPNPFGTALWIEYPSTANALPVSLELLDAYGRRIGLYEGPFAEGRIEIPTADLAAGLYVYRLSQGASLLGTGKLLKSGQKN
ncbi:1,4-alpha-glucan-branching protein [bacterium]|nr:1,4-alpha-glucan-branching protein [bacterium]